MNRPMKQVAGGKINEKNVGENILAQSRSYSSDRMLCLEDDELFG